MFEHSPKHTKATHWLALVIGNTRLHWGYFYQDSFLAAWHTPHLTPATIHQLQQARFQTDVWGAIFPQQNVEIAKATEPSTAQSATDTALPKQTGIPAKISPPSEIWIASAVPEQTLLWLAPDHGESLPIQSRCSVHEVVRSQIPLHNIYPTLGIDRAITLLGAGQISGWPIVVIDSGTALTFTAGTKTKGICSLYGGAILPGLRLQRESLIQKTAVLGAHMPPTTPANRKLPVRWAMDTEGAIASGLAYSMTTTLTDYLTDWWQQFPDGKAIMTGGDASVLHRYLQQRTLELASRVPINHDLMFYGMQAYRNSLALSQRLKADSVGDAIAES